MIRIRKYLTVISFLLIANISNGEAIRYSYDKSGNRISRTLEITKIKKVPGAQSKDEKQVIKKIDFLKVYPNPTYGEVNVEITTDFTQFHMHLFDLSGNLIRQISSEEPHCTFDIGEQPDGIYILNVQVNNDVSSWKIIKK